MGEHVALITDGRLSGAARGLMVGSVGPEAAPGGPIAQVQDSDRFRVHGEARMIDLPVDATEVARRRAAHRPARATVSPACSRNSRNSARPSTSAPSRTPARSNGPRKSR
jgi:dihydroxy-acid dehydratase